MKYVLRLYVSGQGGRSRRAIENLKAVCAADAASEYDVEIIDVLEHPHVAEEDKILATPTLVRRSPAPLRRIVGDLSARERVVSSLGLLHEGIA